MSSHAVRSWSDWAALPGIREPSKRCCWAAAPCATSWPACCRSRPSSVRTSGVSPDGGVVVRKAHCHKSVAPMPIATPNRSVLAFPLMRSLVRPTYRVVHVVANARWLTTQDWSGDYVNGPVGLNRGSPRVCGLYARRGAREAVVSAGWRRAGGVDPWRQAGWRERGQASSRGGDRRRGCGFRETHLERGVAETWPRDGSRAAGC